MWRNQGTSRGLPGVLGETWTNRPHVLHGSPTQLGHGQLTFPKLPLPSTMRKLKSVSFTLSRLLEGCLLSSEGLMTLLPAGPSLAF